MNCTGCICLVNYTKSYNIKDYFAERSAYNEIFYLLDNCITQLHVLGFRLFFKMTYPCLLNTNICEIETDLVYPAQYYLKIY